VSFALAGYVDDVSVAGGAYFKVNEKLLGPGSYAIIATASGVGAGVNSSSDERGQANECRLQYPNGTVIGVNVATGSFNEFFSDTSEMTVTGGFFVPEGASSAVSLWCRSQFGNVMHVLNSQIMAIRHSGFTD
jgi:hypothetical protein